MNRYIEIFTILSKYTKYDYPLFCEHDVLGFLVPYENISKEDMDKLNELDVFYSDEYDNLITFV